MNPYIWKAVLIFEKASCDCDERIMLPGPALPWVSGGTVDYLAQPCKDEDGGSWSPGSWQWPGQVGAETFTHWDRDNILQMNISNAHFNEKFICILIKILLKF